MKKGQLADLAANAETVTVRVTPQAARNDIVWKGDVLHITVTAPPENGKANKAAAALLAKALGVPKSALMLVRGHTSRNKTFRIG